MNPILRCATAAVACLLAVPCLAATPKSAAKPKPAAAAKPAPIPDDDLTTAATRHVAICPPPKAGRCVIKKPIATGYRVLTAGVDLEDKDGQWIADFSKGPKGQKVLLQVLGLNGDLHDIEVSFQGKPAAKKAAAKKQ
ncbi:MAG: hypothetical protein PHY45_05760 [Rhodocyclaceae bacterium]|nr:hypothetical protein [Rhodocyclaceae bacterium]